MNPGAALTPQQHQQHRRTTEHHMSPKRHEPSALLSLRTMVIIVISLIVGIAAGGLTYWYISPRHLAAAILAAVACFAGTVTFLNDIIAAD
jgi:hypothetical protein